MILFKRKEKKKINAVFPRIIWNSFYSFENPKKKERHFIIVCLNFSSEA